MKAIKPRDGEHPLVTKKRQLHRELSTAYALIWCANGIIWWNAGAKPIWLLFYAPVGVLFGVLGYANWRWSR